MWNLGRRKTRVKTRNGENVRAVTRLTVGRATGACARQSALGLVPVGGDSRNCREKRELAPLGNGPSLWSKKTAGREKFACRRGEKVSRGKRAAYWLPVAGVP